MPIYPYRCDSCGFEKDHLQKLSDPLIDACPSCGSAAYARTLTAAGFQLKGSGWYETDFKGCASKPAAKAPAELPPCAGGSGSCACAAN